MRVEAHELRVSYSGVPVLRGVDFAVGPGTLLGVVGPNGAGKTTLLKALLGLVPLDRGDVRIDGQPLGRRRRWQIAYLPQRSLMDWDYPAVVEEVVAMGRYPHLRRFRRSSERDRARVQAALDRMRLSELAGRPISELSGGQQQRMLLARALAQEARLLLLDEPFAGVDAPTERLLHEQLRGLRDDGATLLVVDHDLATVSSLYDRLLMVAGTQVAFGPTEEVFTPSAVAETYGTPAALLRPDAPPP